MVLLPAQPQTFFQGNLSLVAISSHIYLPTLFQSILCNLKQNSFSFKYKILNHCPASIILSWNCHLLIMSAAYIQKGSTVAQWYINKISDWLETEGRHVRASPVSLCCVLEQDTFLVQPSMTRPDITERLLTGAQRIKSNKQKHTFQMQS